MKYTLSFFGMLILFRLLAGCKTPTATSYTVYNYLTNNGMLSDMMSRTSYITDQKGFIEFRLMYKESRTYVGDELQKAPEITFDTIAVLYHDPHSRQFYEVDTFNVAHKLIRKGKYSEKDKGVPLRDSLVYFEDDMIPGSMRDTVMDGKAYKVVNMVTPDGEGGRKRKSMAFFDEKANFKSIMNEVSTFRSHPKWAYVSALLMDIESGDMFLTRIEDIRPVSTEDLEKFKAIRKTVRKAGGK